MHSDCYLKAKHLKIKILTVGVNLLFLSSGWALATPAYQKRHLELCFVGKGQLKFAAAHSFQVRGIEWTMQLPIASAE